MDLKLLWFAAFFLWGLPLSWYRSRFRKMVYDTTSWTINIKPVFRKELLAILSMVSVDDPSFVRFRNFYRFYLIVYLFLGLAYIYFG